MFDLSQHHDLIDHLQQVTQPIQTAKGLPNPFYVDPEATLFEQKRLLLDGWACIGFGHDVARPGALHPTELAGVPLLMVRDRDGNLQVFHNVCRHRGVTLVESPTTCRGLIRCPYHSWTYGLDGQLKATPMVGGAGRHRHPCINTAKLGLVPVASGEWRDLVFVNVSGDGGDFADFIAPLAERWVDFNSVDLHHGGADSSFQLTLQTNWKLAVENYCESYHLPWIHPGLNSYSRIEDHYHIEGQEVISGQGTCVYRQIEGAQGQSFPSVPNLPAKWHRGAEYVALFPNVLSGVHKDHMYHILLTPLGPTQTIERVEIYYFDARATTAEFAELRQQNAALWRGVFIEDVNVVERMQRGRASPGFDGGTFSPVMDPPTHDFHKWVAERLLTGL